MYVCLCNAITDRHVQAYAHAGAQRPTEVLAFCGCQVQCASCTREITILHGDEAYRLCLTSNDKLILTK